MPDSRSVAVEARDIREALHEEWEALGLMSYHGDGSGGWHADLIPDDVGKIRALLKLADLELARRDEALTALAPLLSVRLDGSEDMAEFADALAGLERAREIVARALRGEG